LIRDKRWTKNVVGLHKAIHKSGSIRGEKQKMLLYMQEHDTPWGSGIVLLKDKNAVRNVFDSRQRLLR